ncbi:MAG: M20/M25/M40 family metallo-hydrolase, partial [Candidatus Tectomicrobia bacterium]|nr:M20/M25/M40 family metallo-hydrolase [Candidatus Tectomicrobia bacterium]
FGHPQVYGELITDPKKKTILFYSMYDVQPVEPGWEVGGKPVNPFGGEIHRFEWFLGCTGTCLINRGITNQKGPTQAFFNVLRTIKALEGELPVNFIFAIEGEEELASIHMESFIANYREKLKRADLVYFPMGAETYDGNVQLNLGVRGVFPMKIRMAGGDWGGPTTRHIHSGQSGIVQNPVFKLAELLCALKNDDTGEVLVPGVWDDPDIVGPDPDDRRLIDDVVAKTNFEEFKEYLGVNVLRRIDGQELKGAERFEMGLFRPGISVNGVEGGYAGPGSKTIIPFEVRANLDVRLSPFQKLDKIKQLYREFLAERFPMAEVTFGQGYPPAKMSASHPVVQALVSACKTFDKEVMMAPLLAGSAPFSLFQGMLGLPFVIGGLGHGGRAHSPNEYMVLKSDSGKVGGIIDFEKSVAVFLDNVSRML